MRNIKFGDLKIGDISRKYIQKALDGNWVSEGPNVQEFEKLFAKKFGYKHAIATSSGTDADIVACASLYDFGAKRRDEIILPALCFTACANSILAAGFIPKFVDIERETLNINPVKLEQSISPKTKGIMAVHTMGKPCDMDKIMQIEKQIVIEDACEALGARYKGKLVGDIGDIGTFSFYTAHIVIAGEGGMVVTHNEDFDEILGSIKSHGRPTGSTFFNFQRIGFNSKMNELTAAVGLESLINFDETFKKRKENLNNLLEMTKDLEEYCYFIKEEPYKVISPHAFPLVLRDPKYDRDKLYIHLERNGIECKTLFGCLPTQHKAFKFLGYKYGDFPEAEYVGNNGLHFGIHQYLTEDDLIYMSETLRKYFK